MNYPSFCEHDTASWQRKAVNSIVTVEFKGEFFNGLCCDVGEYVSIQGVSGAWKIPTSEARLCYIHYPSGWYRVNVFNVLLVRMKKKVFQVGLSEQSHHLYKFTTDGSALHQPFNISLLNIEEMVTPLNFDLQDGKAKVLNKQWSVTTKGLYFMKTEVAKRVKPTEFFVLCDSLVNEIEDLLGPQCRVTY